jgi:methylase of polypeptide subunit release factors
MIKNNKINNIGVEKRDIDWLLGSYSVKDIETSLIKIFLEINNLNTKNELLLEVIRKNHEEIKERIKEYLQNKHIDLNLKNLERFFELLIEPEDRKVNGAYYTPLFIVDYMVNKVIKKDVKICDCSCGSGAFLVGSAERLKEITKKSIIQIIENNLYGCDISKSSIYRTKVILSLLSLINGEDKKEIKFNLIASDSLKLNWRATFPEVFGKEELRDSFNYKGKSFGFDVIIGNPPYVRIQNLDDKTKEFIRKRWATAKKYNVDLYIPFIELSLDLINTNGEICLITAKSYFDSEAGKQIRKILRDNRFIEEILDFNFFQIFEDVITYTSIILLNKKNKENLFYHKVQNKEELKNLDKIKFTKENYKDLPEDKIIINGHRHIVNLKKITGQEIKISKKYQIRIGIATLRDKLYFIEKTGNKFIKEKEGKNYEIEEEMVKKLLFANNVKSRNERKELFGWVIFPYEFKNGRYEVIREPILKQKYPLTYSYFKDIKKELMTRDKGRERIKEYGEWYAYGRVQGYNAIGKKLICPNMMPEPRFEMLKDDSLFIAGYGIVCNNDIEWLNKILNSDVFWYYIKMQGKKIRNEFYVVGKKLLGDFSIPNLTDKEKKFLIEENQDKVNEFLKEKYGLII